MDVSRALLNVTEWGWWGEKARVACYEDMYRLITGDPEHEEVNIVGIRETFVLDSLPHCNSSEEEVFE